MKIPRAFPLVAFLTLATGSSLAAPTDITRYDCRLPESDRPAGGARTVVSASPELVRSVVLDFEHYAYYFDPDKGKNPSRKWASHVVGRSGDKTDVYLEVPILKGAAKIWAIIRFDTPQKVGDSEVVVGRMLKGNVNKLHAKWKLRRTPENNTELQLEFLVVPKVPIPDSLLADEARGAAGKAVRGMQGEALKRAAGT